MSHIANITFRKLLFLVFLLIPALSYGQSADLQKAFDAIQQHVVAVESGNSTYEQKMALQDQGVVRYEYEQTDAKGKTVAMAYEFNLADLDPYAVREQTKKDLISLNLNVKNKQKLVKEYKNGAVQSYSNELSIICKDVDNARSLSEAIKKAIPFAEKLMENRLKAKSYEEMLRWLTQNVKDVSLADKSYKQSLAAGDYVGTLKFTQTEVGAKTSQDYLYEFNLADLNPNTINFKVTGNKFLISLETQRKQKLIGNSKNGAPASFTNDLEIVVNNVEEARDLRSVLALAIPEAVEKVKNDMPKLNSSQEALNALAKWVQPLKLGDTNIEQKLEAGCISTYQITEQTPKATTTVSYQFNLMDINENLIDYDISGAKLFIELQSKDKLKLVKYMKADALAAYENSFKIYAPNVEVARRMKHVLEKAVTSCRSSHVQPFAKQSPKERIEWMIKTVGEVSLDGKTYHQNLELADPSDLKKIKFTQIESDSKKTTEEIYEFNLTDIDPKSVTYSVKGKWLSLSIDTNHKAKIIKHYQNGQIKPYTNTIELKVNDVEKARSLIAALSGVIEDLKQ